MPSGSWPCSKHFWAGVKRLGCMCRAMRLTRSRAHMSNKYTCVCKKSTRAAVSSSRNFLMSRVYLHHISNGACHTAHITQHMPQPCSIGSHVFGHHDELHVRFCTAITRARHVLLQRHLSESNSRIQREVFGRERPVLTVSKIGVR